MALGFGILRLEPRAFWQMTLPEITAAARTIIGSTNTSSNTPSRQDLASLLSIYPDQNHKVQST